MVRSVADRITSRWGKYVVVVFWLVIVVLAAPFAGKLSHVEKNDAKSWLPGGAESTRALSLQATFTSPDILPAVVVYERPAGLTDADRAKINSDTQAYGHVAHLDGQVTGPILAPDGKAAQVIIPLNLGAQGFDNATGAVTGIKQIATAGANGIAASVTGPAGNAADSSEAFQGIDSTLLVGTVGIVVLILLFTYRSPALWLLPVISAGVALVCAEAVIYLLARNTGLVVNAQSAGILTVLVFGASTDYALLLVARYREELHRHEDRHEAMTLALRRAGPAIIASAATVAAGMLCLLIAETNSTKGLGPVAAIGVGVGLAVMLTLLPALLVIVGRWIFWPARPAYGAEEPNNKGVWARVGKRIARHPRIIWIITTLVLGAMAIGLSQLNANGLTQRESFRTTPDSVVGEEILARHFPAGAGSPVIVIGNADRADEVRSAFAGTEGIDPSSIQPAVIKNGLAYLQGTPTDAPDTPAAFDTVDRVRERVHAVPGAGAMVGGNTAVNLDVQRAARNDRNLIIPIVLGVVFVILTLLLRAIVGPLLLIATVVLSFAAALGASALVFRYLFGFDGADTALPLFVFVFLVALGIDYNIFLMTRVREEGGQYGTRRGALIGLAATGGVITSAGIVLAGTFAVLASLPLTTFAEIGFAVAFGVLLDTIVVRAVLVTALTLDIGDGMWWPGRLSRNLRTPTPTAPEPPARPAGSAGGSGAT